MNVEMEKIKEVKDELFKRYKNFKNYSLKFTILFATLSFAVNFFFYVNERSFEAFTFKRFFVVSLFPILGCAILGYCIGALISNVLQRKHFLDLEMSKQKKRRLLQEQIELRESKLGIMSEG